VGVGEGAVPDDYRGCGPSGLLCIGGLFRAREPADADDDIQEYKVCVNYHTLGLWER
jgi:hypothetical protein